MGENGEVRHWKTTSITKASDPGLGAPNQGAERRCWSDAHNLTAGKRKMKRFQTWRFDPAFCYFLHSVPLIYFNNHTTH